MTVPDVPRPSSASRWSTSAIVATTVATVCIAGWIASYAVKGQLADACGSILTVTNPEGTKFERLFSDVNITKGVTRLVYGINWPGVDHTRRSVIVCAFGSLGVVTSTNPELVAASVDGKSFGPARIAFLNRFWLARG